MAKTATKPVKKEALNLDLLTRLCETPGVAGREERVRALIEAELR